ncbi:RTJK polymerase, partial [Erythrocercus mccallii]|nr:RTJK polymerase [Erythrocercus mccallii]
FRKANLGLLRELLGKVPWDRALEGKGAEASWLTFKHHFLQAQDQCIPKCRKSSKRVRRPAWLSRELLLKLKQKREIYKTWKEGQATWEEYREVVKGCRDATRKAKASLEIKLAREIKDNKKSFYKYVGGKKKPKSSVGPLLDQVGTLVTEDREKAELLNATFASVFTSKVSYQESQVSKTTDEVWREEVLDEAWVRDQLSRLVIYKSMGPDGLHPRVLREMAEVIARPLSIIFERSWRTGEVPEDWRKANVVPIFKKGKKEDPGNYRPVSLTSIPGKVMEQLVLDAISKHLEERRLLTSSQHGFRKGKSCLSNLIAFY